MLHVFAQLCRVKHVARPSVPFLVKGGGETNFADVRLRNMLRSQRLSSSWLLLMSDWKAAGHVAKLKLSAGRKGAPMASIRGAAAAMINGGGKVLPVALIMSCSDAKSRAASGGKPCSASLSVANKNLKNSLDLSSTWLMTSATEMRKR